MLIWTCFTHASFHTAGDAFGPQLNPAIAVAASVAAVPPLVFWGRVLLNARRRVIEDEQREQDRLVCVLGCGVYVGVCVAMCVV